MTVWISIFFISITFFATACIAEAVPAQLVHLGTVAPDVIGLTAMTHEIVPAALVASLIKEKLNIPAIVGGCHLTALPKKTLEEFPAFDFGLYGEGERTILEFVHYLESGSPRADTIHGLVFRNQAGRVHVNAPRSFLSPEELDGLPYPAFHHYYGNNPRALAGDGSYYVMFTHRGCPYSCAFCMRVLGNRVRRRSAQNVIQEIEYAIAHYGTHTIDFEDDIFLFNNENTRELLNVMVEKDLPKRVRWSGLTRADFVNPDLVSLAKRAGCYRLEMGIEAGEDTILKSINKAITVEQVKRAVAAIKEAGISLGTYFILGHPNENRETVRKTVDLAAELNTDTIAVGLMVPYPGTKIYDMSLRGEGGYRLLTQEWSQYDKYGGRALEIKGLPYKELVRWQRRALINFYVKNLRFLDALRFFWHKRNALWFLIKKKFAKWKAWNKQSKQANGAY